MKNLVSPDRSLSPQRVYEDMDNIIPPVDNSSTLSVDRLADYSSMPLPPVPGLSDATALLVRTRYGTDGAADKSDGTYFCYLLVN